MFILRKKEAATGQNSIFLRMQFSLMQLIKAISNLKFILNYYHYIKLQP